MVVFSKRITVQNGMFSIDWSYFNTLEVRNFVIQKKISKFRIRVWEKNEIRNFEYKNFDKDFEILIRKFR